jgi:hypothetical protein
VAHNVDEVGQVRDDDVDDAQGLALQLVADERVFVRCGVKLAAAGLQRLVQPLADHLHRLVELGAEVAHAAIVLVRVHVQLAVGAQLDRSGEVAVLNRFEH